MQRCYPHRWTWDRARFALTSASDLYQSLPCFPRSASMEAVGLGMLEPAQILHALRTVLRQGLRDAVVARLSLSTFCAVNSIKGPWSFLDGLQAGERSETGEPRLHTFSGQQQEAVPDREPPRPHIEQTELLALVQGVAIEVVGADALTSSGMFAAGLDGVVPGLEQCVLSESGMWTETLPASVAGCPLVRHTPTSSPHPPARPTPGPRSLRLLVGGGAGVKAGAEPGPDATRHPGLRLPLHPIHRASGV